jgi:hypothetical protein
MREGQSNYEGSQWWRSKSATTISVLMMVTALILPVTPAGVDAQTAPGPTPELTPTPSLTLTPRNFGIFQRIFLPA